MVDIIKAYIRSERLGDYEAHLSIIASKTLDIFVAAWHGQYGKGAQLSCQHLKSLEKDTTFGAVIRLITGEWTYIVRYSTQEWSGVWTDMCIEPTLMRSFKSEGGVSRGRMRSEDSGFRVWVAISLHKVPYVRVLF